MRQRGGVIYLPGGGRGCGRAARGARSRGDTASCSGCDCAEESLMHDGWRMSDARCVPGSTGDRLLGGERCDAAGSSQGAAACGSCSHREWPTRRARLSFTPKLRTSRPLSLSCAISSLLRIRRKQKLFAELIDSKEAFTFHFATRNIAATTRWG